MISYTSTDHSFTLHIACILKIHYIYCCKHQQATLSCYPFILPSHTTLSCYPFMLPSYLISTILPYVKSAIMYNQILFVHTHSYTHTQTHTHPHTYTHMHTHIYTHTYTHINIIFMVAAFSQ